MQDPQGATAIEQPNSCEISVNAKGDVAFKVKAYAESVDDAIDQAIEGHAKVKAKLNGEKTAEA